ncbi:hypothetical protein BGX24_002308, partial [Mortierella sp. AD032]
MSSSSLLSLYTVPAFFQVPTPFKTPTSATAHTMSKESHTTTPPRSVPQHRENDGDDKSVSSQHVRKRVKFMNISRPSTPEPNVKVEPQRSSPKVVAHRPSTSSTNASVHGISTVGTHDNIEIKQAVTSTAVQNSVSNPEPSSLSFKLNVNKPAVCVSLHELGTRISTTPQLVLCIGLPPKNGDAGDKQPNFEKLSSDSAAQCAWFKVMKQNPVEQEHIRWLGTCMVEEFAKDAFKDLTEIAEMILLSPVLDRETYRKLLS